MQRQLNRVPYLLTLLAGLAAGVALRSCAPWPTPPAQASKFVCIYESQDLTPEQAAQLASVNLRSYLETSPYWWRIVDKDVVDGNGNPPAALVPYLDKAKSRPLPWYYLGDQADAIKDEGPLPASDAAMISVLKQHETTNP